MTIVNIIHDDDTIDIDVSGHADYDNIGKDIVCAGISAITYALINTLYDINADVLISGGDVHIRGYSDNYEYIDGVLRCALNGYTAIEEQYPDNIQVISAI